MCGFSSGNNLPWLVKGTTLLCTSKTECNKLDLTQYFSDWSIIMISRGGLLLVVPTYMQFEFQFYWWGCKKKKKLNFRHLILSSRVTYWALLEMLLLCEIVGYTSVSYIKKLTMTNSVSRVLSNGYEHPIYTLCE